MPQLMSSGSETLVAIAQLGERNAGSVEVGGSIPPGSTTVVEPRGYGDMRAAMLSCAVVRQLI